MLGSSLHRCKSLRPPRDPCLPRCAVSLSPLSSAPYATAFSSPPPALCSRSLHLPHVPSLSARPPTCQPTCPDLPRPGPHGRYRTILSLAHTRTLATRCAGRHVQADRCRHLPPQAWAGWSCPSSSIIWAARARLFSPAGWQSCQSFRSFSAGFATRAGPGLYGVPELTRPEAYAGWVARTKEECEALVKQVGSGKSAAENLRRIDAISDRLCKVADSGELCRSTAADPAWREAAEAAFSDICDYMEQLNTDDRLYKVVLQIEREDKHTLTPSQARAASLFRADFERRGGHLRAGAERQDIRALHASILGLESAFLQNIHNLDGLSVELHNHQAHEVIGRDGVEPIAGRKLRIQLGSDAAQHLMVWSRDAEVRRKVHAARYNNEVTTRGLQLLDALLTERHKLATLMGHGSYSEYSLSACFAQSPAKVEQFLLTVGREQLLPRAKLELEAARQQTGLVVHSDSDLDNALYSYQAAQSRRAGAMQDVSVYFSLEHVIQGLQMLLEALFNVAFEETTLGPGEAWDGSRPDSPTRIRKFRLKDLSTNSHLGTIYWDLFARPLKVQDSASFAIRGARQVGADEQLHATILQPGRAGAEASLGGADPSQPFQPGAICVVASFAGRTIATRQGVTVLLDHHEVVTVFHEMGHSLHHALSRTEFQDHSGTRMPLDFVETPSQLFEKFARDERVLSKFAKHFQTGQPIPGEAVRDLNRSRSLTFGIEQTLVVQHALLALRLHGPQPLPASTSQLFHQLKTQELALAPTCVGTAWHATFSHLIIYGPGYYSYLYCHVFADRIWQSLFAKDPWSREAGHALRRHMLEVGNAREPLQILTALAGPDAADVSSLNWRDAIV